MVRITMSGGKYLNNSVAGVMLVLVMMVLCSEAQPEKGPALFVFGDSLVEVGNNNYLSTYAKANYPPYGIDFGDPTGRFSNGKTFIDFIGDELEVPYPPAYANLARAGESILHGVNFASANAGILEESGYIYGERYSLSQQVQNFEQTLNNYYIPLMNDGPTSEFLAKSIAVIVIGNNDYLSNYFLPTGYGPSSNYTATQFANILLDNFLQHLETLHSLGLRKFFIAGLGPLGCIPNQRAVVQTGGCWDVVNQMVQPFNAGLRSMVDQLNENYKDSMFVYGNTYEILGDMLNNPADYAFTVIDRACCGGLLGLQRLCIPYQPPCSDRNQFFFWDPFHPTQAAVSVYASRVANGPPNDSYPMNIKHLALY